MPETEPSEQSTIRYVVRMWLERHDYPAPNQWALENLLTDLRTAGHVSEAESALAAAVERAEKAERDLADALIEVEGAVWRQLKADERADHLAERAWSAEAQVAKVRALLPAECWVSRSTEVHCIDYVGGTFNNGAEFTESMACLPCRILAALGSAGATEGEGGQSAHRGHVTYRDRQPGFVDDAAASLAAAEPERDHVARYGRWCGQCGRGYDEPTCGPRHTLIARELPSPAEPTRADERCPTCGDSIPGSRDTMILPGGRVVHIACHGADPERCPHVAEPGSRNEDEDCGCLDHPAHRRIASGHLFGLTALDLGGRPTWELCAAPPQPTASATEPLPAPTESAERVWGFRWSPPDSATSANVSYHGVESDQVSDGD